jgi:sporulation protein YlmC with PRC-barrel domain
MIALSDLLGAEVRSQRGETLGRVRDVQVRLTADGTWEVDRLLLGRRGLAVRLGIPTGRPATDANSVSWTDVRSIEAGVVTAAE